MSSATAVGWLWVWEGVRLLTRFAALAAAIALNHRLGRPPRSLANYTA
jgi:heme oxygenase